MRRRMAAVFGNQANDCLEPRSLTSAILLRKFSPGNEKGYKAAAAQHKRRGHLFFNAVEWLQRLLSIALDMPRLW